MLSCSHFGLDTTRQGYGEVPRLRCHRFRDVRCFSLLLRKFAAVDVVSRACRIWKEGEISQRRTTSSSTIMHSTESSHVPILCRKTSLVTRRIDIGNSFCHIYPKESCSYRMEASHQQTHYLKNQWTSRYGVTIDRPPLALPISKSTYCSTSVAFCAATRMEKRVRWKARCPLLLTILIRFSSCCRRRREMVRIFLGGSPSVLNDDTASHAVPADCSVGCVRYPIISA
jgi:hypothetical protein